MMPTYVHVTQRGGMRVQRAVELFDLREWVDEFYPDQKGTTTDPDLIRVKCEQCGDWKYRLYIHLENKLAYCHNCGYDPKNLIQFLMDHEDKSRAHVISDLVRLVRPSDDEFQETIRRLTQEEGDYIDEEDPPLELKSTELPPHTHRLWTQVQVKGPVGKQVEKLQAKAKKYLRSRGINGPLAYRQRLYVCYAGKQRNRIVFPVVMNGKTVSWVARAIDRSAPGEKYINPPGVDQGTVLWGFDNARVYKEVIITEGVFDALKVGDNAVVSFGKNVTPAQVSLIEIHWDSAVLLLDPDAMEKAYKVAKSMAIPVKVALLPPGVDAGESDPADLRRLIEKAPLLHTDADFQQQVSGMLATLD
jgi:DNA primase